MCALGTPLEKILFDTDIGSDIDDAVALAWLLANDQCELAGITTVSGQPEIRGKLASVLCEVAEIDIPIIPGNEAPLLVEPRQPIAQQAESLERWKHLDALPSTDAVDFMAETIADNPGEITLLAVGPMTNVAKLFKRHPASAAQIKQLVLMCGRFGPAQIEQRAAEWNVYCDPHAAQVVLNTAVPNLRAHGLDVTTKVQMDASEVRDRFSAPLLQPVLDMAEEWFSRRPLITFHDPLAAVAVFEESLCSYQHGRASVTLENGDMQGSTSWEPDDGGPVHAAFGVDADQFFDYYFGQF